MDICETLFGSMIPRSRRWESYRLPEEGEVLSIRICSMHSHFVKHIDYSWSATCVAFFVQVTLALYNIQILRQDFYLHLVLHDQSSYTRAWRSTFYHMIVIILDQTGRVRGIAWGTVSCRPSFSAELIHKCSAQWRQGWRRPRPLLIDASYSVGLSWFWWMQDDYTFLTYDAYCIPLSDPNLDIRFSNTLVEHWFSTFMQTNTTIFEAFISVSIFRNDYCKGFND
jgi:hypothetical protein